MNLFYSSPEFEERYTYTGKDLGATWTPEKTLFRVWAPTAEAVTVNLYASGTPGTADLMEQLPMTADVNGTWVAEKAGDLNGVYYTYLVTHEGQATEACDPYARTTGLNGRRAMVIDLSSTNPEGWEKDTDPNGHLNFTDTFLYELHVRDLSMDESSGITNKGKFLGLAETGTRSPEGIPTGLDHIKDLGMTHIHLLPVYDYGFTDESLEIPQYNWGYDPENYNVPEGSYSTDPTRGEIRVREMKQMVKTLHENGISVIMDVVYNHVYHDEPYCFNQIVPGYFSRIDGEGTFSNGSFCGNDTASERSMVRKYIVDSVNYWADEYHIDGFRFDLVGLIDIDTINEIVRTVKEKHPNVIFYGEGWDMPTQLTKPGCTMAIQKSSPLTPGFAYFSDTIRDLLRGDIREHTAPGFVAGLPTERTDLDTSFMGMPEWAAQPSQCVNYVSCHDNHSLFDRIALTAPEASRADRIKMNNLAAAFSILAQGVPFMQAGEEMLRTKPDGAGSYDDNSYRAPDAVNAIKWSDLVKPEYAANVEYYKGLIAFRKAHAGLRCMTREQVLAAVTPLATDAPQTAAYLVKEAGCEMVLLFNAGTESAVLTLDEGTWDVNILGSKAGTAVLDTVTGTLTAEPISVTVATRYI